MWAPGTTVLVLLIKDNYSARDRVHIEAFEKMYPRGVVALSAAPSVFATGFLDEAIERMSTDHPSLGALRYGI